MDLLRLYIVNILRPIFENPKLSDEEEEDEEDKLEHLRTKKQSKGRANTGDNKKRFESIELLDSSGPKLIHGIRHWLLIYQLIGQLNLLGKPLYLSIIYKSILLSSCFYVLYRDILEPFSASTITEDFKNPIFAFISLSSVLTVILLSLLTFYNNLFHWCPIFKVLTTERLCFVHRDVQDIIGNHTIPSWLIFHAYNCLLFRLLVAKNFQEFIYDFDIVRYLIDAFVLHCVGYHLIGMSFIDCYIRLCFGVWIIAMKTNLENRFAYLQKHQRVRQRLGSSLRDRSLLGSSLKRNATSDSMATNLSNVTTKPVAQLDQLEDNDGLENEPEESRSEPRDGARFDPGFGRSVSVSSAISTSSIPAATHAFHKEETRSTSHLTLAMDPSHMTLADFRAKYKIDTMDEIQKNLNTMDDHLEVSRDFQNGMLVLMTLSAFLTNGALLLLAYNLLANQGDYYHGVVIVLISVSYTMAIFVCYIGDSWISYALESFVQTVEDEYFLQSANGEEVDDTPDNQMSLGRAMSDTVSNTPNNQQQAGTPLPPDWSVDNRSQAAGGEVSDTGSEVVPYADLIRQHHQLFIIKKRDVLFCREFLNQFQNHLATPWSKLTVKVQLHMLGTFVTLIAAQIIFDREH